MEFTRSSPSDQKSSPEKPFTGQISAGVASQRIRKPNPTQREISDPLLSSDKLNSVKVSAGVIAPVTDQWSRKAPEKPIPNRIARSLLSLKDVREAARKLRKTDPTRHEIPEPLLCSDVVKSPSPSPSVSESPACERKKHVNSVKLPEKYEMLEKFFNSMDSSIRLLQLKGSATTFTNISAKVESLTDKRFTCNHLAQLKFILPEAIEIEKIPKYVEPTSCMKPDLYVTLNANAVDRSEKLKSNSSSVLLRKIFRSRLLDFFKFHPGGDDIPEEMLPSPLTPSTHAVTNSFRPSGSSLTTESPNGAFPLQSVAASPLSGSFQRCFSNRASFAGGMEAKDEDRVGLVPVSLASIPLKVTKKKTVVWADASRLALNQTSSMKCSAGGIVSASSPCIEAKKREDGSMSAPATPMLEPPKRCYTSPDDDPAESPIKIARRSLTRRSLFFDTSVNSAKAVDQVCENGRFSTDDDVRDIVDMS